MPIQPFAARHKTDDLGDRLKISIASQKQWLIIIFLGLWLMGWAVGESAALAGIFGSAKVDGSKYFMIIWLCGWTMGGLFALFILTWQLFGKEVIEISSQGITTRRAVFGFGFPKEYAAEHILALRVSNRFNMNDLVGLSRFGRFYGMQGGLLAFDYGAKTIGFGIGIEEAEAKQILEEILQRFPQYRSRLNPE